jgi:cyclopropane-fatty-acyl-phospholipid synthase
MASVTTGYRIRLDFPDGQQLFCGPPDRPIDVALRPPQLWRLIWILLRPGLRTGEGYVRGDWDITEGDLVAFLSAIQMPHASVASRAYYFLSGRRGPLFVLRQRLFPKRKPTQIAVHYEAGNDLYERMLDPSMQYSCAFFDLGETDRLDVAQQAKLRITIERLRIDRPGLRILDIGCGWGALAAELAAAPEEPKVIGITLSQEQFRAAEIRRDSLPDPIGRRLNFCLIDYKKFLSRDKTGFDRIVSIGMFEHLGLGRHNEFYTAIAKSLHHGGRALIHTIIRPSPGGSNEWIRRYVFPGSYLPSLSELIAPAEKAGLLLEAVYLHSPADYRRTLEAWRGRLEASWPDLQRRAPITYDERVRRLWFFYLSAMQTIFTEDGMSFRITQIELRKNERVR